MLSHNSHSIVIFFKWKNLAYPNFADIPLYLKLKDPTTRSRLMSQNANTVRANFKGKNTEIISRLAYDAFRCPCLQY